eukprot:scaffold4829_cov143-Isochrysis_galbana.AAC.2
MLCCCRWVQRMHRADGMRVVLRAERIGGVFGRSGGRAASGGVRRGVGPIRRQMRVGRCRCGGSSSTSPLRRGGCWRGQVHGACGHRRSGRAAPGCAVGVTPSTSGAPPGPPWRDGCAQHGHVVTAAAWQGLMPAGGR